MFISIRSSITLVIVLVDLNYVIKYGPGSPSSGYTYITLAFFTYIPTGSKQEDFHVQYQQEHDGWPIHVWKKSLLIYKSDIKTDSVCDT